MLQTTSTNSSPTPKDIWHLFALLKIKRCSHAAQNSRPAWVSGYGMGLRFFYFVDAFISMLKLIFDYFYGLTLFYTVRHVCMSCNSHYRIQ